MKVKSNLAAILKSVIIAAAVISCIAPSVIAQKQEQEKIDSLLNELKKAKEDTNKVKILNYLSKEYGRVDEAEGKKYIGQALVLSAKLNFKRGTAAAMERRADYYSFSGDYLSTIKVFKIALSIYTELRDNQGICYINRRIGQTYMFMSDNNMALDYYQKALAISEKMDDEMQTAGTLSALGVLYNNLSNNPKALECLFKSLKMAEHLGFKRGIGENLTNIGNVYNSMKNYPKALEYYEKSLVIAEEVAGKTNVGRTLANIGTVYQMMNNYDKALEYYQKALKIAEDKGDKVGMAICDGNIGSIHDSRFDYTQAIEYLQKALDLNIELGDRGLYGYWLGVLGQTYFNMAKRTSQGIDIDLNMHWTKSQLISKAIENLEKSISILHEVGFQREEMECLSILSDVYAFNDNFKKAFELFNKQLVIRDSLFTAENQQKIASLESKRDSELKEKELVIYRARDKQQKIIIGATAAGVILLLIIIVIIVLLLRSKQRANELLTQKNDEIRKQKDALKESQVQLIQSEKMASLGMLTAGIAHEINNPVNFINSGAVSLQRDYDDLQLIIQSIDQFSPGKQKLADELGMKELLKIIPQTIEDIKTGVQRTMEIVKGLRNFTRLDVASLKEADIHEGINSTLLLLNHKIKDRISVIKDFDEGIGPVNCYPGQLNQVFMNLLNNAIDAIDQKIQLNSEGGESPGIPYKIGISTRLTYHDGKKHVEIVISDNGAGIPYESRDKLFDPFYTTKAVGKGTGLGLFICHGIIEKHGGHITFESDAGKGTAFTIYLPV